MTFVDNGNGTATLSGTPAASTAGTYPLTITAANGVAPNATQSFTLTVAAVQAPADHQRQPAPPSRWARRARFTVTTTGFPTPTLSESGHSTHRA